LFWWFTLSGGGTRDEKIEYTGRPFLAQRCLNTSEALLNAELAAAEALPNQVLKLRRIFKRTVRQYGLHESSVPGALSAT